MTYLGTCKWAVERKMAAKSTVNLDALIPRDDFAADIAQSGGNPRGSISITDLDSGFFSNSLRKPDFQRETTHWEPQKIVDLIRAFLDGDLIPAVILWQRGSEIFAIDGAHRLSALIAWVKDDYGDKKTSLEFFGPNIPDEQKKAAETTRKIIESQVKPYAWFQAMNKDRSGLSADDQARVTRIGSNSLIVQWVTATTTAGAETSFFKINQAAQPIDPTERRVLQSRTAPNSIAARCIVRGSRGHKYWSKFAEDKQEEIEKIGQELYEALYTPPLREPIKTLDIPVAGRGYNALPFIYDLVNISNQIALPDRSDSNAKGKAIPEDTTGDTTLQYMKSVKKSVQLLTTDYSGSLGLHPAIYFYGKNGNFLPNAFLAASEFAQELDKKDKKKEFTKVRAAFENYITENKTFISLTINRLGSAARSLGRIKDMYWRIFDGLAAGKSAEDISKDLFSDADFAHLATLKAVSVRAESKPKKRGSMSKSVKSAVFLQTVLTGAPKCAICNAAVHFRSVSIDHIVRSRDGGSDSPDNGQIAHPFCNSGYKS